MEIATFMQEFELLIFHRFGLNFQNSVKFANILNCRNCFWDVLVVTLRHIFH